MKITGFQPWITALRAGECSRGSLTSENITPEVAQTMYQGAGPRITRSFQSAETSGIDACWSAVRAFSTAPAVIDEAERLFNHLGSRVTEMNTRRWNPDRLAYLRPTHMTINSHPIRLRGGAHDSEFYDAYEEFKITQAAKMKMVLFLEGCPRDKYLEEIVVGKYGLDDSGWFFGLEEQRIQESVRLYVACYKLVYETHHIPPQTIIQEIISTVGILMDCMEGFTKDLTHSADQQSGPVKDILKQILESHFKYTVINLLEGREAAPTSMNIDLASPQHVELWPQVLHVILTTLKPYALSLGANRHAIDVTGTALVDPSRYDGRIRLHALDKLILDWRNRTWAQNIIKVLPTLPKGTPVELVVGGQHIPGLKALFDEINERNLRINDL